MVGSGLEIVEQTEALREIAEGEALPVDARSEQQWNRGHVIGAVHLPGGEIGWRGKLLPRDSRLMVIAESSLEAARAAAHLAEQGYEAVAVSGGARRWTSPALNVPPSSDCDFYTEFGLN